MILLLPLLLACTGSGDDTGTAGTTSGTQPLTPEEVVAALGQSGSHNVGYTEQQVDYTDPAGQPRSLRTAVWYPTSDDSGSDADYLGLVEDEDAWTDATIKDGSYPVIIFSHGNQGYAECAGFLMRHLASHGWLVLSPDHTNNTIADAIGNETEIYFQRPADLTAVLDHAASAWASTADMDTVIGMGHSFGGYTMYAWGGANYDIENVAPACYDGSDTSSFCATMNADYEAIFAAGLGDDRVDAILPIGSSIGGYFGETGLTGIGVPTMFGTAQLEGAHDSVVEGFGTLSAVSPGTHRLFDVLGADHNFLLDLTAALDIGATIDDEEGWRIVRTFSLAWALRHGLGDSTVDVVLDSEIQVSTDVELSQ